MAARCCTCRSAPPRVLPRCSRSAASRGFISAARWLGRGVDPYRFAATGVVIGIAAFTAVIFAQPLGSPPLFAAGRGDDRARQRHLRALHADGGDGPRPGWPGPAWCSASGARCRPRPPASPSHRGASSRCGLGPRDVGPRSAPRWISRRSATASSGIARSHSSSQRSSHWARSPRWRGASGHRSISMDSKEKPREV